MGMSVDGFIARPDGGIDWLDSPDYVVPGDPDFGYGSFIATVDAIVMGRKSFEKVLSFGQWPYDPTPVIVLSSGQLEIPAHLQGKAALRRGEPHEIVSQLAAEGKKHLYIDGGVTVQRFLRARLIDEITITRLPVILGGGIPLFGSTGFDIRLRHVRTEVFPNGFVQSKYEVVKGN